MVLIFHDNMCSLLYSPAFGGRPCEGESREYEVCNTDVCFYCICIVFSCYIPLFSTYSHVLMGLLILETCSVQLLMPYHLMDNFMHGNYLLVNVRRIVTYTLHTRGHTDTHTHTHTHAHTRTHTRTCTCTHTFV